MKVDEKNNSNIDEVELEDNDELELKHSDNVEDDLEIDGQTFMDEDNLVLTTIDNPYNPKKDYDKWRVWDEANGYYTESYLLRVANIPPHINLDDEPTINKLIDEAIFNILEHDSRDIYILV